MPKRKKTPGGLTDDIYPQFHCGLWRHRHRRADPDSYSPPPEGGAVHPGGWAHLAHVQAGHPHHGRPDVYSGYWNRRAHRRLGGSPEGPSQPSGGIPLCPGVWGHRLCGRFPEAAPPRQRGTDRPPEIFPAAGGGRRVCHPDAPGRLSHPGPVYPLPECGDRGHPLDCIHGLRRLRHGGDGERRQPHRRGGRPGHRSDHPGDALLCGGVRLVRPHRPGHRVRRPGGGTVRLPHL